MAEPPRARRIPAQLWEQLAGHRQELVHIARRAGASRHEAEDAVHDAFIRVMLTGRLEPDRPAFSYLRRTVLNVLHDEHLRARRAQRLRPWPESRPGLVEDEVATRDMARRAVHRLVTTEPQRTVEMVLRRVRGDSWREVGAACGVSASAAQAAVHRALIRLRLWIRRDRQRLPRKDLA